MSTEYDIVVKTVDTHDVFGKKNGTVDKYDIVGKHTGKVYASDLDRHDRDIAIDLLDGTSDEYPKCFYPNVLRNDS